MAQAGEIPISPSLPPTSQIEAQPQHPVQSQHPPQKGKFSTAKRRREEEDPTSAYDTGESDQKRQTKAQDVIFRIIVPSKQVGKVIGKGGHRIQKIREDTKANIKIADAIIRHEERVIIISSKDNEDMVSDAENALQQIATLILVISGDFPAVLKALAEIGCQLRENPPRQVISISPAYNFNLLRPAPPQAFVNPTSGQPLLQLIM